MKAKLFFLMVFSIIIIGCEQKTKDPIEGVWEMIFMEYPNMEISYPGGATGEATKSWTTGGFTIGGEWQIDTIHYNYHGWGTYTLEDTHYTETIINHPDDALVGETINMIIIVRNDTLIQKWPVDDNWIPVDNHNTEKYIRLK
ncbi:hypothetical protein [Carboxylicivirga caseinilyticus]|uniref:hypothetical protein n=1 Tax=Carboxylicivirga caseinilyticus TaxID=3417572 RepID=UPI003D3547B4|nr:hypothetical protein [Marinilabiliaceae bacterium A049]